MNYGIRLSKGYRVYLFLNQLYTKILKGEIEHKFM